MSTYDVMLGPRRGWFTHPVPQPARHVRPARNVRPPFGALGDDPIEVPTTRAAAITAFVRIMRSAASEDTNNANFYKSKASEATYKFANAPVWNIMQTAAGLVSAKAAPQTKATATMLAKASTPARSLPAPSGGGGGGVASNALVPVPQQEEKGWEMSTIEYLNSLPRPALYGGIAAVILAGLYAFWPGKRVV